MDDEIVKTSFDKIPASDWRRVASRVISLNLHARDPISMDLTQSDDLVAMLTRHTGFVARENTSIESGCCGGLHDNTWKLFAIKNNKSEFVFVFFNGILLQ